MNSRRELRIYNAPHTFRRLQWWTTLRHPKISIFYYNKIAELFNLGSIWFVPEEQNKRTPELEQTRAVARGGGEGHLPRGARNGQRNVDKI